MSNDFTYKSAGASDNLNGVGYLVEKPFGYACGSEYAECGGGKKKYKGHVVTSLFFHNL